MGKYIRHLIGAAVGLALGAIVTLVGADPSPDQVQGITDSISNGLAEFVMLVGYAFTEKFLKRFRGLDKEGWVDHEWLKAEAEGTTPKRL